MIVSFVFLMFALLVAFKIAGYITSDDFEALGFT